MSHEIVSEYFFGWFMSLFVGILSAAWLVYDVINLYRTRHSDRRDALVRDKRFGYVMGLVIATIGIVGTLRFRGVI